MNVTSGQRWECNEARADPDDVPEPHDTVPLWEDQPRFTALVDRVQGDYVELTATTGNSHPRTPDFGAEIALSASTLRDDPRWKPK